MTKAAKLLKLAEQEAPKCETWADFSNYLFDQSTGVLATAFSTRAERETFGKTPEYQQIWRLMDEVLNRTGLVEGATPKRKSGRFVVRLPESLHAALEVEAKHEGVSLNQLVVAKLACQLSDVLSKKEAGTTKKAVPA